MDDRDPELRGVVRAVDAIGSPSIRISPASGCSAPARTLITVLLPAPFLPSRPSTTPGADRTAEAVEREHPGIALDEAAHDEERLGAVGPRRARATRHDAALPEPAEQDGGDQDAALHEVDDVGLEVEHRQPGLDDAQEQHPDDRPGDVELARPEDRRPEERGGEGRQQEAQRPAFGRVRRPTAS